MIKKLLMLSCILHPIADVANAQTNLETNAGIQFNFSTPGASNLALGGAFLALADDASAAYTNPAGLTSILEPEVMVEGRIWEYTHIFYRSRPARRERADRRRYRHDCRDRARTS